VISSRWLQLLSLAGLVHFGIPLTPLGLGGARGCDQGGIHDRALLHGHAVGLKVDFDRLKDLLTEIVPLQQLAEAEDRGFIRDPVGDQGDASKATHRRHLNQRILHCWTTEVVPLLHQVNPQHGLQRVRRTAALRAGLGVGHRCSHAAGRKAIPWLRLAGEAHPGPRLEPAQRSAGEGGGRDCGSQGFHPC
jgi:hypothetical protein